jgi:hypothetical protein
MNLEMMKNKKLFSLIAICLIFISAEGEKKYKSWDKWDYDDCWKILDESPWVSFVQFGVKGRNTTNINGVEYSHIPYMNYRLFSSRPIRLAYARLITLRAKVENRPMSDELKKFVDADYSDKIIISALVSLKTEVPFDNTDPILPYGMTRHTYIDSNYGIRGLQFEQPITVEELRKITYLQFKSGRKVYLQDYFKAQQGSFGAQLIFPRKIEGKPILESEQGEVELHITINGINQKAYFKISDLRYEGKLEY